ncbi:MAG: nitroreductase family deazaflavin-dependent oxidoreductase [Acidimicrobiia bacterium]
MPAPRWLARFNRRYLNAREIRGGSRPVLTHVGRASGTMHETPLEVVETSDGFLVLLVYGPESDWVKNTLAAGTATVRIKDEHIAVGNPRVVELSKVNHLLPDGAGRTPSFMNVTQCLQMDRI